uniref:Uncharacterized protein n=1 Tax=Oryza glumipatula TaxID=40148 RepID=A0A0E0AXS7_9ORYZ
MAAAAAAAQWCGAAGLDRWVGRWRCTLSPAALPVPSRRTRRKGGVVGCVSVPREVAAAAAVEPAAPPEAEAETELSCMLPELAGALPEQCVVQPCNPHTDRTGPRVSETAVVPCGSSFSRKSNRLPFVTVLTLTSLRRPIYHRRFRSLGARLDPGQGSP